MPIESKSSHGQFIVLQEGSPYIHQGAYRRSLVLSSDEDIIDYDKLISPDIKSSYIQQNLPVRRQSLQVYHNRRRSISDEPQGDYQYHNRNSRSPKRHSSLNFAFMFKKPELSSTSQLLHETPLPTLSACTLNSIKSPKPTHSLSVQINYCLNTSDTSSENLNSATTSNSTEFPMDTLIEENEDNLLEPRPKQPVQRFMGRLRPSKSDQSCMSRSFYQKEEASISRSWNEVPQPLTKLKSVLSRIQSSSNNKRNNEATMKKSIRKSVKTKNNCNAYLSYVADELLKLIPIKSICIKYGINYHDVFYGSDMVTCLVEILQNKDRVSALAVGKSLAIQGFFHHVNYEYKLCDDDTLYQFHMQNGNWPYDDLPLLSKKANRRLESSFDKSVNINGVLTLFTGCYSPTCTPQRPCYSISCPDKTQKKSQQIERNCREERTLWRYSVPLNVVTRTPDIEKRRQECIYELIYTEEDFTKDLHYIQDFWIKPILCGDIIAGDKKHEFIHEVFWNLSDIKNISESLLSDLRSRQNEHSVIPKIGDIILSHAQHFTPFVSYGAHQIFGKSKYEIERKKNSRFQQFAEKLERQPESRRLELNGYLTKPTAR
ncbi:hypothetical protein K501DRAFT_281311, partial [Backusella circina FSU 941]